MARLSLPTRARLSSALRVDSTNPSVIKTLNRLSRNSLLTLVLDWLDEGNQHLCPPTLRPPPNEDEDDEDEHEDDFYPPARSLHALQQTYVELQSRKGSRREVVDRILEGDWRHGISLYQLAMADQQYLYDHPGSLKWTAYRIQRLQTPLHEDSNIAPADLKPDKETLTVPRFHPSTFLQNLQAEVLPDVKAHYNFARPQDMPLLLLRIFILDSPYNTDLAVAGKTAMTGLDASRTIYIAFPDASPHVYISRSQSSSGSSASLAPGESKSLQALIVDGIPKALSRPRERYALKGTGLSTRNLGAMLAVKGSGRGNAAGGGWGLYAKEAEGVEGKKTVTESPLNVMLPTPPLSEEEGGEALERDQRKRGLPRDPLEEKEERERKRAKIVARARFGPSGKTDDGKGVERVDIVIEDPFSPEISGAPAPRQEDEDEAQDAGSIRGKTGSKGRKSEVDLTLLEDEREEGMRPDARADDEEQSSWRPRVRLTFHGAHVFAGIRQLVEAGIVDGEKMPGWMTGEEGVTVGAVRHGRIRGHKGSGL
ncbi:CHL4-domain-containing protein [Xylariomycetidae sp. FL2044]|nr:CHL4-domain-containing protein [Xylariomycetidae sp. FL2044]